MPKTASRQTKPEPAPKTRAGGATPAEDQYQPTFERLDLKAALQVGAGLRVLAGVDNLLDRRIGRAWPGFTGRLTYAGIAWSPR